MRNHGEKNISIALNLEVEPTSAIDPCLPNLAGLIVLLGAKRGVADVLHEELDLLVNFGPSAARARPGIGVRTSRCIGHSAAGPTQAADGLFRRIERPLQPSLPDVLKGPRELPLNDTHGRQRNFVAFDPGLQQITHAETGLLADRGRKRNLILAFHPDELP